jgi:hypothetical protein
VTRFSDAQHDDTAAAVEHQHHCGDERLAEAPCERRDGIRFGREHVARESKRARRIDTGGGGACLDVAGDGGADTHPQEYNRAGMRARGGPRAARARCAGALCYIEPHPLSRVATMPQTLQLILILLGAAVVAVVLCRLIRRRRSSVISPSASWSPHALALVPESADVRDLAEFGIVFLMFSTASSSACPS